MNGKPDKVEGGRAWDTEDIVAGRRTSTSLAEFAWKCEQAILEEQRKPAPDNALIGLLGESVRLAREHSDLFGKWIRAKLGVPEP